MVKIWFCVRGFELCFSYILRAKWVMLQNKNKIQKPLINALMLLRPRIALLGSENGIMNSLPSIMNSGAPGGWGI